MYKKKRKFAFFGRPHSLLGEKTKTDETKKGLQELLLVTAGKRMDIYSKVCCCLDFFLVAVSFFYFYFPLLGLCRFYGQL